MRSVSWQAQHFLCVAGAVFAWQAQLSSCAMLPNLTRRKTKEGRMPGLRPEAKAPFRCASSVTFHHLGRVCVAGIFASSQNRSLSKQRPHSPGANCVQLQDVVALNSVLAVATWAVALALLCLGWRGQSVASGVSRTQVSVVTWCPWIFSRFLRVSCCCMECVLFGFKSHISSVLSVICSLFHVCENRHLL